METTPQLDNADDGGSQHPLVMLLPCPLCRGEAEIERKGSHRASMIVTCTNCGCSVESGDVYGLTAPERMAWNRRSKIPQHNVKAHTQKERVRRSENTENK